MTDKKLVVLDKDRVLTLLEANVDQQYKIIEKLELLNKKKDIQIEQQKTFQKAWKATKKVALVTATTTVVISLLVGIVDPKQDGGVMLERAFKIYERLTS